MLRRQHGGEIPEALAAFDGLHLDALSLARASDADSGGILPILSRRMGLGDVAPIALADNRRWPPRLEFDPFVQGGDQGLVSFEPLAMRGTSRATGMLVAGVDAGGAPLLLHLMLARTGIAVSRPDECHIVVTARAVEARRLADAGLVADLAELLGAYEQLGTLLAMFDACLDYVRGRTTGDWRLGAVPAVREQIAEIYLSLLMLRTALDEAHAAFRTGADDEGGRLLARARLAWFERAAGCAGHCMELHGGIAVVAGHGMQRLHHGLGDRVRLTRAAAYWRSRLGELS
ncbi:acyl-CoA dehydrogenase family protein [Sphingomonas colocasiae]|uniref:Acyl-CoA dehydrogenase family protein n=1 Tax=Sphingomonas colocasiae TaxID=1848973 RepID=A0ABS7PQH1_9SPHN|nr:acyl-CoA dehydrogenase family protein [Sphingomonas colocasiae]MBY8823568.1 acyl-CoA dehydrogenase family protein [Sphingomonas colocasiae]